MSMHITALNIPLQKERMSNTGKSSKYSPAPTPVDHTELFCSYRRGMGEGWAFIDNISNYKSVYWSWNSVCNSQNSELLLCMLVFQLYLHRQLSGVVKPPILLPSRDGFKSFHCTAFEELFHPSSQLPQREAPSTKAEASLQETAAKLKPLVLLTHPEPRHKLHLPVWLTKQEKNSTQTGKGHIVAASGESHTSTQCKTC